MIVKTNFNRENRCIDVRQAVWVAGKLLFPQPKYPILIKFLCKTPIARHVR